jgi:cysteine desulfurase
MVYLDYAANSPVDEEVLDLFYDITKKYYANPNSIHKLGLETKKMIDDATSNIAKNLNIDSNEIIYTSGASESNNLAVKGICERYKSNGKHIIVSTLEHNSIIAPAAAMQEIGFDVDVLPVLANGLVNIDELKKMIREDTILVSVCSVDSEIGIRQPIEEIAKIVKEHPNCHFHTDASQAIGKVSIDFSDVDLITITPHKFFGMTGTGLLIKKKNVQLKPIINGGKSTTVYRAGTPELANIISLDIALEKALKHQDERIKHIKFLHDILIDGLNKYDLVHINNTENSIPSTINISVKGVRSLDLAKRLEESDIYVSTKTSCCPSESPSKLVYALTKDKSLANSSLRISLAHLTKKEEIEYFLDEFDKAYKELTNGKI